MKKIHNLFFFYLFKKKKKKKLPTFWKELIFKLRAHFVAKRAIISMQGFSPLYFLYKKKKSLLNPFSFLLLFGHKEKKKKEGGGGLGSRGRLERHKSMSFCHQRKLVIQKRTGCSRIKLPCLKLQINHQTPIISDSQ
jgi:hypothetical protein